MHILIVHEQKTVAHFEPTYARMRGPPKRDLSSHMPLISETSASQTALE
jgi:hypothetical protein